MSKKSYVLTGLYNKPCTQGGVKVIPADGNLPERREVVQVAFVPGKPTETELDMSAAVASGFIREVATDAPKKSAKADDSAKKAKAKADAEAKAKADEEAARAAEEAEQAAAEEVEEEKAEKPKAKKKSSRKKATKKKK